MYQSFCGRRFIDSLWINAYLGYGGPYCQSNIFAKKYSVGLLPNDTIELHLGWFYKFGFGFTNFLEICFTVTSPNNLFDNYHANDTLCSKTTVTTFTGINNIENKAEINLFPNPCKKDFSIQSNLKLESPLVELYDCMGKLVLHSNIESTKSINIESLADGIYFYKISDKERKIKRGKLVIAH